MYVFSLFFLQKCSEQHKNLHLHSLKYYEKVVVTDFWNFDFCLFYGPRNIKKSRFFQKSRSEVRKKCHKTAKNQKIKNLVLQVLDNTPKKWFVKFQRVWSFFEEKIAKTVRNLIFWENHYFVKKSNFFLTFGQNP